MNEEVRKGVASLLRSLKMQFFANIGLVVDPVVVLVNPALHGRSLLADDRWQAHSSAASSRASSVDVPVVVFG